MNTPIKVFFFLFQPWGHAMDLRLAQDGWPNPTSVAAGAAFPECSMLHIPTGFSRWLPLREVLADLLRRKAGPVALFVRKAHWPLLTAWFEARAPDENVSPELRQGESVTIVFPSERSRVPLSRTSIHLMDGSTRGARAPVDMHVFGAVVADIGRDHLSGAALHVIRGRLLERRVVLLSTVSIVRGFARCALEETDGWGFEHRVSCARPSAATNSLRSLSIHDSLRPLSESERPLYFTALIAILETSTAPISYRQETLVWCVQNADWEDNASPARVRAAAVVRSMKAAVRDTAAPPPTSTLLGAFCVDVHAAALCKCVGSGRLAKDMCEMVQAWANSRGAAAYPARLCARAVVLAPSGGQALVAGALNGLDCGLEVESHTFKHGVCRGFNRWRQYASATDGCRQLLMHLRNGNLASGLRAYSEGVLANELLAFLRETRIFVVDIDAAAEITDVLEEANLDALFLPWPSETWICAARTAVHAPRRLGTLESALLASGGSPKRKLR